MQQRFNDLQLGEVCCNAIISNIQKAVHGPEFKSYEGLGIFEAMDLYEKDSKEMKYDSSQIILDYTHCMEISHFIRICEYVAANNVRNKARIFLRKLHRFISDNANLNGYKIEECLTLLWLNCFRSVTNSSEICSYRDEEPNRCDWSQIADIISRHEQFSKYDAIFIDMFNESTSTIEEYTCFDAAELVMNYL